MGTIGLLTERCDRPMGEVQTDRGEHIGISMRLGKVHSR